MANIRKKRTPQDKAKIVLEVLKGELTMSQITAKYGVQGAQISAWKKQALKGVVDAFTGKQTRHDSDQTELIEDLYKQIGQLTVELGWLKKKSESILK